MPTFSRTRGMRLTLRQMRFVQCLFLCFNNGTEAVVMAGYSPKSAKWQAYRLRHTLTVQIYFQWLFKNINDNNVTFNVDGLIHELHKFGAYVNMIDLLIIEKHPPTLDINCVPVQYKHLARTIDDNIRNNHNS